MLTDGLLSVDDHATACAVVSRLRWRLLPVLWLGQCLSYIVRSNIAFGELQMGPALSLSHSDFGMASGLFFLTYSLMQVPSVQAVAIVGPRRALPAALLIATALSMATGWVQSKPALYCLRLGLGVVEAGFAPGAVLFVSRSFPNADVGMALAIMGSAGGIGYAISSLTAGSIMRRFDAIGGADGWRWLFWLQGSVGVPISLAAFLVLPDRAEDAAWLSQRERRVLCFALQTGMYQSAMPPGTMLVCHAATIYESSLRRAANRPGQHACHRMFHRMFHRMLHRMFHRMFHREESPLHHAENRPGQRASHRAHPRRTRPSHLPAAHVGDSIVALCCLCADVHQPLLPPHTGLTSLKRSIECSSARFIEGSIECSWPFVVCARMYTNPFLLPAQIHRPNTTKRTLQRANPYKEPSPTESQLLQRATPHRANTANSRVY